MLTQFQGGDLPFQLMQNSWASELNPIIKKVNSLGGGGGSGGGGGIVGTSQEFAWNAGTVTTAGGSDLTSFGNGPQGTPILAYDSTTAAYSYTKFRCQFQTPFVMDTDLLILECQAQINQKAWQDPFNAGIGWSVQNQSFYGIIMVLDVSSDTQLDVWFGNMGRGPYGNGGYGGAGTTWGTLPAGSKWRVRKISFI